VADATAQTLRTADGRTLCFADWGPPHGYPVLALHGSPGSRLNRNRPKLLQALGGRLITYDRPGYGRSDRKPGRTAVDCVPDIETLADALGLERFAVLGGSTGAPHALAVGARLGVRLTRLGCFAPFAPLPALGWAKWSKLQDKQTRRYLETCERGERAATEFLSGIDAEKRAQAAPGTPRERIVTEQTLNGVGGWVDDELAMLSPWGFEPREISVPTAIWCNPRDTVTPLNHAEWLAATIPGAVLVASVGAPGHVRLSDPDATWTRVYSWLLGEDVAPERIGRFHRLAIRIAGRSRL
jgi:pimeloyl-ACP methyl ester carboxylesterase